MGTLPGHGGGDRRIELELVGGRGEPVDLWRTIQSHGLTELPPMRVDEASRSLEVTVPLNGARPRMLVLSEGRAGHVRIEIKGRPAGAAVRSRVAGVVRRMLGLDADLSAFYAVAAADPDLAWAARGAGRMLRSPTVFEEVVKTVCTTNCSWGATTRMVGALVEHLGEPAVGAPSTGPLGRAFPTPGAMAEADEGFYRDVVRAGYRGRYLVSLARGMATGEIDLESLASAPAPDVSDDEVERALLTLPGVGPYAAAHIMMLLGRHSRLVLDSWTRPKYARLIGRKTVSDAAIARRWRNYGPHAGLAFWLFLTRDWVEDHAG